MAGVLKLSAIEFDICWEYLGLGATPVVLDIPSPGRTFAERQQIAEQVLIGLRGRGLAEARHLNEELEAALRGLAKFSWSVDAELRLNQLVRALGTVHGQYGVAAARYDDVVDLFLCPDYEVLHHVVGLAGDVPAGSGQSISVRVDALEAVLPKARGSLAELAERLVEVGESMHSARSLARVLAETGWQGQFGVTCVDRDGRQVRAARMIAFHDNPGGRYLQLRRKSSGVAWLTISPAGHQQVVGAVKELIDETSAL